MSVGRVREADQLRRVSLMHRARAPGATPCGCATPYQTPENPHQTLPPACKHWQTLPTTACRVVGIPVPYPHHQGTLPPPAQPQGAWQRVPGVTQGPRDVTGSPGWHRPAEPPSHLHPARSGPGVPGTSQRFPCSPLSPRRGARAAPAPPTPRHTAKRHACPAPGTGSSRHGRLGAPEPILSFPARPGMGTGTGTGTSQPTLPARGVPASSRQRCQPRSRLAPVPPRGLGNAQPKTQPRWQGRHGQRGGTLPLWHW